MANRPVGRPRKEKPKLVEVPIQFESDPELGLTDMQSSFVWHYTEGGCSKTEAARRAGFTFPSQAANKMLNGRDFPNVTKAVRRAQEEFRAKYSVTPEKTGSMLWKIANTAFENGAFNASVQAIKELNQLGGLTVHRSQHLHINATLENMNKDDIKKRLNQLLGLDDTIRDDDM